MPNFKLAYRAEIDGLRALAVVSVIFYHAQMVVFDRDWFQGGYLGVDIFFVISGYLITRIILAELYEKKSFNFLNFYERRARRILPMLIVVIIASGLFAWVLLSPTDLVELSKSALTSLLFISNYFFYLNTTEYGADSSLLKPLLHTWSLSIEEQFYLALPFIFLIITASNQNLTLSILLIIFSSFLFSFLLEVGQPVLNFYFPLSRVWEFFIGSILAYRELKMGRRKLGLLNHIVPVFGLFLLVCSIVLFDDNTPHPSLQTMIPILGVASIIAFSSKDDLVGNILASKPFVWTGLISYSAYLWHFPVMSFWRTVDAQIRNPLEIQVLWILISFSLAIASYFLIEKPFRNRIFIGSKLFWFLLMSFTLTIIGFVSLTISSDGFTQRSPSFLQRAAYDDRYAHLDVHDRCHRLRGDGAVAENEFCILGQGRRTTYLVGDSHMLATAFKLLDALEKRDSRLVLMTRGRALLGAGGAIDAVRLNTLNNVSDSVVIFGGYAHNESDDFFNRKRELYNQLFSSLKQRRNKIVLIYPIPSTDVRRRSFQFEYAFLGRLCTKSSSFSEFQMASAAAYDFYDSLGGEEIVRIYPSQFLCDDRNCYGVRDGEILISDDDHPSARTAAWIVDAIFKNLEW